MKKNNWFNITKKQQKEHKKMIKDNTELAKNNWTKFVEKQNKLGFVVEPVLRNHTIRGTYVALINMRAMSIEEYDRYKDPKKWEKIDKENYEKLKKQNEENNKSKK